jgi:hypothetical protein
VGQVAETIVAPDKARATRSPRFVDIFSRDFGIEDPGGRPTATVAYPNPRWSRSTRETAGHRAWERPTFGDLESQGSINRVWMIASRLLGPDAFGAPNPSAIKKETINR